MAETGFAGTESYLTNPALEAAVRTALVLEKPAKETHHGSWKIYQV